MKIIGVRPQIQMRFSHDSHQITRPSRKLIQIIQDLPPRSDIALGWFVSNGFKHIQEDLRNKIENASESLLQSDEDDDPYSLFEEDEDDRMPKEREPDPIRDALFECAYDPRVEEYWKNLIEIAENKDHHIHPLERLETWKEINNAAINKALHADPYGVFPNDSNLNGHLRQLTNKEEALNTNLEYLKLLYLKREEQALDEILSINPALAIVNEYQAAQWFKRHNSLNIPPSNFLFETKYRPISSWDLQTGTLSSTKKHLLHNLGLRKALHYMQHGKFSPTKEPDFRVYWSVYGTTAYAEGYITSKEGHKIEGKIIDYLGIASFKGEMTDDTIEFRHKYLRKYSPVKSSFNGPWDYKLKKTNEGQFRGGFYSKEYRNGEYPVGNVVLSTNPQDKKHALSMLWARDKNTQGHVQPELIRKALNLRLI